MSDKRIVTAIEDNRRQAQPVKVEYEKDEYTGAGASDDIQLLVKTGVAVKRNTIVVKDSNGQFVLPDSTILATIGDKLGEATYGCVKHLSGTAGGVYATISDNRKPFFGQIDNPEVATFSIGDVVGVTATGTIKSKYATTGTEKLKCIVLDSDDNKEINRSTGLVHVKFITARASSGSYSYNGYFKTSNNSSPLVTKTVFVGSPVSWADVSIDTVAGYVCFDDRMLAVPAVYLNFTCSDFVILEVNMTAKTAILKAKHTFPSMSGDIINVPIAYVVFDESNTAIQDIIQLQYGIVYLGTGGKGYTGHFKVISASNELIGTSISVIDGYSEDEPVCGYVYIDDFYPVNTAKNLAVSDSGHVLLTIDTTNEDVVCTLSFDHEFSFPQDSELDIQVIPIAYIAVLTMDDEDETKYISEIQQLQFDIPYFDLLKFPSLILDYDATKRMALVIDEGVYTFIEIGNCQ